VEYLGEAKREKRRLEEASTTYQHLLKEKEVEWGNTLAKKDARLGQLKVGLMDLKVVNDELVK